MRIAVIGASGNVGTALLRALHGHPDVEQVVAIARRPPSDSPSGREAHLHDGVRWYGADIVRDDLRGPLEGCDSVVHLAWLIQPSHRRDVMNRTNVHGSRRVFDAAVSVGASSLVFASSVGVYSRGPKDRFVDENWPRTGIASSSYSRDKATVEAMLDSVERAHPSLRVVRLRPGLIFQHSAATEITRYFIGPLVLQGILGRRMLPVLPVAPELRFQAVHADDVAAAYVAALMTDVRGAFNIAAEPVLDGPRLAELLQARYLPVPLPLVRIAAATTWRLRLQPAEAGWVDLGAGVPLMDVSRAKTLLGWAPRLRGDDAVAELLRGMRDRAEGPTPVLSR